MGGRARAGRRLLGGEGGVRRRGESGDETRLGERGGIKATRKVVGRLRNETLGRGASEPRSFLSHIPNRSVSLCP